MARPNDPRYPIYIPSKGRWEDRLTSKALESMRVPYRIVVEPQEHARYAAVIDPRKILTLPFSNRGLVSTRNWIWEHSISEGHARHWQLDDNIRYFHRFQANRRYVMRSGATFRVCEDFTDRYTNAPMSGMQYAMFAPIKNTHKLKPISLNTRVYSNYLLANDVPHRFRGLYNDDTDLSLRFLKDGYCTILFNAFLAEKVQTMTCKGGNTEQLYVLADGRDGRLEMARSLRRQHPDVVKIVRKWGRWQHQVDYRPFRGNKLIRRPGVAVPEGVDNYGMRLSRVKP
jgi:hypothetical protein